MNKPVCIDFFRMPRRHFFEILESPRIENTIAPARASFDDYEPPELGARRHAYRTKLHVCFEEKARSQHGKTCCIGDNIDLSIVSNHMYLVQHHFRDLAELFRSTDCLCASFCGEQISRTVNYRRMLTGRLAVTEFFRRGAA